MAATRGMTRPQLDRPVDPDDPISSIHETEPVKPRRKRDRILLRTEQTGPAVLYLLVASTPGTLARISKNLSGIDRW